MARTGDGSRLLPPHWNPCAGPQAGHTHLSGKLCSEMGGNSWQEASTLINHDSCLQALLIKCLLATGSQRHLSELGCVHELDRSRPAQTSPADHSKDRQGPGWGCWRRVCWSVVRNGKRNKTKGKDNLEVRPLRMKETALIVGEFTVADVSGHRFTLSAGSPLKAQCKCPHEAKTCPGLK